MVSQGIARGEITASWHVAGADVVIQQPASGPVAPAAVTAIGAVRGVRHATEVWNTSWFTLVRPADLGIRGGPGQLRRRGGVTPRSPFPAGLDRRRRAQPGAAPGAAVPVLASPPAAAILGTRPNPARHAGRDGTAHGPGRGHRERNPAQPRAGPFVIMPLLQAARVYGAPAPNLLLATGSGDRPHPADRGGPTG